MPTPADLEGMQEIKSRKPLSLTATSKKSLQTKLRSLRCPLQAGPLSESPIHWFYQAEAFSYQTSCLRKRAAGRCMSKLLDSGQKNILKERRKKSQTLWVIK